MGNPKSLNNLARHFRNKREQDVTVVLKKAKTCTYIGISRLWALCPPGTKKVDIGTGYPRGTQILTLVSAPELPHHLVHNQLFVHMEIGRMIAVLEELPKTVYIDIAK